MSLEASSVEAMPGSMPLRRVSPVLIVLGVIVALVLLGFFVWGIIWLAQNQAAEIEVIRDIVIIGLALESCLFGIAFLLLLIMFIRLITMLEFEIKPILEQTNETVSTLRGTTAFVSHNVVKPVAAATGYVAGARRGLKVLFGNPRRNLDDLERAAHE